MQLEFQDDNYLNARYFLSLTDTVIIAHDVFGPPYKATFKVIFIFQI